MNAIYEEQQDEAGESLAKSIRVGKVKQLYADRASAENPNMQRLRGESAAAASDKLRDHLVEFMAVEANKRDQSYGFALDPDLNEVCHALSRLVDEQLAPGPENVERRRTVMTRIFAHGNDDRNTYDDPDAVLHKLNRNSSQPGSLSKLLLQREIAAFPTGVTLASAWRDGQIYHFKASIDESGEKYIPVDHQARELVGMMKDRVRHLDPVFADTERDSVRQFSGKRELVREILRIREEERASSVRPVRTTSVSAPTGRKRGFNAVDGPGRSGGEYKGGPEESANRRRLSSEPSARSLDQRMRPALGRG